MYGDCAVQQRYMQRLWKHKRHSDSLCQVVMEIWVLRMPRQFLGGDMEELEEEATVQKCGEMKCPGVYLTRYLK